MRPHDEDAASARAEPRIGVLQVCSAVECDDGLARPGTAVDDERPGRGSADDRILIGLDRAQHVAHPRRPRGAEARDEGRLVIGGEVRAGDAVEDLVAVVDHRSAAPAVPAPAAHAVPVGEGRREEGLGGGGAPIDEQHLPVASADAEAPDVAQRVVVEDETPEAGVDAEAAEDAQPRRHPMHGEVALERRLAVSRGHAQELGPASLEVVALVREGGGDGGELPLIGGDARAGGFVGKVGWKGEHEPPRERAATSIRPTGGLAASPHPGDILEVAGRPASAFAVGLRHPAGVAVPGRDISGEIRDVVTQRGIRAEPLPALAKIGELAMPLLLEAAPAALERQ